MNSIHDTNELEIPSIPFIPIIRSVDKPSSSLPKNILMSEDFLRSWVGFHRIDTLKRNFSSLYQPMVSLDHTPPDAILDPEHFALFKKKTEIQLLSPDPVNLVRFSILISSLDQTFQ